MPESGELKRIWVKPASEAPMQPRDAVELVAGKGIVGDAQFSARRPVTLISEQRWQRVVAELGPVDPVARRANLLVSGVDLEQSTGRVLRVGPARLLVRGETRPCSGMDEQHPGLQAALKPDWGGGAWAEVLDGGSIEPGAPVVWEPPES